MRTFNTIYTESQATTPFDARSDYLGGFDVFHRTIVQDLEYLGVPQDTHAGFFHTWREYAAMEQRAFDAKTSIKTAKQFLQMLYNSCQALSFCEAPFDMARLEASMAGPFIELPPGLSRAERRAFILAKAKELTRD